VLIIYLQSHYFESYFFRVITCVLRFAGRDWPSRRGQSDCDTVDNQRNRGAKIAGVQVFGSEAGSVRHIRPKRVIFHPDGRSGTHVPITIDIRIHILL
jgi:hypothetical protein